MRTAIQSIGMFLLVQFVMKQLLPQPANNNTDGTGSNPVASGNIPAFAERPLAMNPDAERAPIPNNIAPMWGPNTPVDLAVYVSPSLAVPSLSSMPKDSLVLNEKNFGYGNWKDKREIRTKFKVPQEVQHNATLWAHFFVGVSGAELDPTSKEYDTSKAYHFYRPFTQHLVKKRVHTTRNLLAGANETKAEEEHEPVAKGPTYANFYHENFTLSFVPDGAVHNFPAMHPAMRQFVQLERTGARDATGQNGWYYPVIYVNTFWQLRDHMVEVNETTKELPLNIWIDNVASWKFSIFASIDEGMKMNREKAARGEAVGPGGDGSEFEVFKSILLDSNPYLLATTGVVSVLHMIFEMLAFKSDVSHWRKKKDNVGTSVRTIIANVVMQMIIFLYLMDNNENTSWVILVSQGMGIAIEAWKITKTVNVRIRPTPAGSLLPYTVAFEDKHKLSETEKKTQEYDQIAFKYMYWVGVPLLLAYAVYSLLYQTHKSWYSFIITTLVGSVYAYGFLLMVPSLYINYRLKSVAHMPAKAMMYKFLNTFIDDLFAFTIKMPMLHRLATLRDDVIFFVYLYQSWKYKVDYTRVNEFGQGGDDDEDENEVKKEGKPTASPEGSEDKAKAVEDVKENVKASGAETQGKGRKRK
jgi:Cleft lip and palate transmembrane protein 1 (CLPTM1)